MAYTAVGHRGGSVRLRTVEPDGTLTSPALVSDRRVVQNAVDSDQVGADALGDAGAVHVLFIEEGAGELYHARSGEPGVWSPAGAAVRGRDVQWVRGARVLPRLGGAVYGFVYDAGSDGGSGMNRYAEVPLAAPDPEASRARRLPGDHGRGAPTPRRPAPAPEPRDPLLLSREGVIFRG